MDSIWDKLKKRVKEEAELLKKQGAAPKWETVAKVKEDAASREKDRALLRDLLKKRRGY